MSERRLTAVVIGPGKPGSLKMQFGQGRATFIEDVPTDQIPVPLRLPNSSFVAVVAGRNFVRVDPVGRAWIEVEDRIRAILNNNWDPIGVAASVDDEYDGYIAGILTLLTRGSSVDGLVKYLRSIEVDRMALSGSPPDKLKSVAQALRSVQLP
jgi:hypothetical protein